MGPEECKTNTAACNRGQPRPSIPDLQPSTRRQPEWGCSSQGINVKEHQVVV